MNSLEFRLLDTRLILIAGGRFLQILSSIVILRVITQQLEPAEYAKWVLFTTAVGFFVLLAISPVGLYINRHFFIWLQAGTLLRNMLTGLIYLFFVCVFVFLCSAIVAYFSGYAFSIATGAALLSMYILVNTVNSSIVPALNNLGRVGQWLVFSLLTLWSGLFFSYLLTNIETTAEYWIIGQIIGIFVGTCGALFFFIQLIKSHSRPSNSRYITAEKIR